eukprot:551449-Lingulodinium_polyedra.AAC.1
MGSQRIRNRGKGHLPGHCQHPACGSPQFCSPEPLESLLNNLALGKATEDVSCSVPGCFSSVGIAQGQGVGQEVAQFLQECVVPGRCPHQGGKERVLGCKAGCLLESQEV